LNNSEVPKEFLSLIREDYDPVAFQCTHMWDGRKRTGEARKNGRIFDPSIVLTLGMSGRNLNVVVFIRLIKSSFN
jgi:hypothetical protein